MRSFFAVWEEGQNVAFAIFLPYFHFPQFTPTTKPFEAAMITQEEIADMVTFSVGVTLDPGVLIAGALVNIESRHD